jgi:hypothetical protein
MLLRRITKHVKDQNWLAVFIDFLIVVVGVFIGIQVANWNTTLVDRKVGDEYLIRVQNEVIKTKNNFESLQALTDMVILHTESALNVLEFNDKNISEQFLLDAYIAGHEIVGFIERDVYEEILSVGALNKIANIQVRKEIQNFYQLNNVLYDMGTNETTYQVDIRRAMPHDVIQTIRNNCAAQLQKSTDGTLRRMLLSQCKIAISEEQQIRALNDLKSANLKASLRSALSDYRSKQSDFKTVISRAEELISLLRVNN